MYNNTRKYFRRENVEETLKRQRQSYRMIHMDSMFTQYLYNRKSVCITSSNRIVVLFMKLKFPINDVTLQEFCLRVKSTDEHR